MQATGEIGQKTTVHLPPGLRAKAGIQRQGRAIAIDGVNWKPGEIRC